MAFVDIAFLGVAILWGYFAWKLADAKDLKGAAKWAPAIATGIVIYAFEIASIRFKPEYGLLAIPIGFFIDGVLGYLTSILAQIKGRGAVFWFIAGALIPIIPMIILVIAPVKGKPKL
jgi:hypothetical protein